MQPMQYAVLIHLLNWKSATISWELGSGVALCKTQGSQVESLYHHLCKHDNVDQGSPFSYGCHMILSDIGDDWGSPYSTVSEVCSMISIGTSGPVGACRILFSRDSFRTAAMPSEEIYRFDPAVEELTYCESDALISGLGFQMPTTRTQLDDNSLNQISIGWNNLNLLRSVSVDNHRVMNALAYFFYSWRAYSIEHMCLNLAIVLESLFSPASNAELSHQISFNVARFLSNDPGKRHTIYSLIRKFYNMRSQIVHGAKAPLEDLDRTVPKVFVLSTQILRELFLNKDKLLQFCDNSKRQKLINGWLFG